AFAAVVRQVAAGGQAPPSTALTTVLDQDDISTTMLPATDPAAVRGPASAPRTMPPLAAGSADEDRWSGSAWDEDEPDPAARRRRMLLAIGAVVLVLAVAGGLFAVLTNGGGGENTADQDTPPVVDTQAASTNSTGGIDFDISYYVGDPVDEVTEQLTALELVVRTEDATEDQLALVGRELAEDTVVTATPARGPLDRGDEVVLYVAADDYAPDEETEAGPSTTPTDSATAGRPDDGTASPTATATLTVTQTRPNPPATTAGTPTTPRSNPPATPTTTAAPPPEEPTSSPPATTTAAETTAAAALRSTQDTP
uniref:hypothetical protein n=1 Tax=Modestobacter roseus TaxID=1181884 RepID=UPI003F696286